MSISVAVKEFQWTFIQLETMMRIFSFPMEKTNTEIVYNKISIWKYSSISAYCQQHRQVIVEELICQN